MVTLAAPVGDYLQLGLRLGRHLDGLVDAYYGPPDVARRAADEPVRPPAALAVDARRLIAALDAGEGDLEPDRRAWMRAQVVGLETTARKLDGQPVPYVAEVEACYGVTPRWIDEDEIAEAHRSIDEALPATAGRSVADRMVSWREANVVPADRLQDALHTLAEDFRERTAHRFGLPDGEHVEWELETDKPWSGFNYYEGGLRSRVAVNVDLPVPSTSLGHLVAHEAYPGHHTEHCRKEVGLVRGRHHAEETIFLVGTPQCLLAEGLADLALEALLGERPEPALAAHLQPLGVPYEPEVVAALSAASEALAAVRGNVALLLHDQRVPADEAVVKMQRWALLPRERAEKAVRFLTDPTWSSYISCYVEGLPLCRAFCGAGPDRFQRLLDEPLTPADLRAGVR